MWDTLLKELQYLDRELIRDMGMGFKMMGWLPESGVFEKQVVAS